MRKYAGSILAVIVAAFLMFLAVYRYFSPDEWVFYRNKEPNKQIVYEDRVSTANGNYSIKMYEIGGI